MPYELLFTETFWKKFSKIKDKNTRQQIINKILLRKSRISFKIHTLSAMVHFFAN